MQPVPTNKSNPTTTVATECGEDAQRIAMFPNRRRGLPMQSLITDLTRQRLIRAATALVDEGVTPPGVDPAHQKVRSASIILPPDQPFKEAAKEAFVARPAVAPVSV